MRGRSEAFPAVFRRGRPSGEPACTSADRGGKHGRLRRFRACGARKERTVGPCVRELEYRFQRMYRGSGVFFLQLLS